MLKFNREKAEEELAALEMDIDRTKRRLTGLHAQRRGHIMRMKQWSKEAGWLDPTKPPKPPKPEKPIKLGKNETLIDPNDHRRMAIWRRGNRLPMEPGDAEHLLEQDRNMAEYLNGTPEQQAAAKARMDAHRSPEDLAREANDRERIAEMLRKEKEANEALNADYAREEFEGPLYSGG